MMRRNPKLSKTALSLAVTRLSVEVWGSAIHLDLVLDRAVLRTLLTIDQCRTEIAIVRVLIPTMVNICEEVHSSILHGRR